MKRGLVTKAGRALAVFGVSALAGCGAPGQGGMGLADMVLLAGPTVAPAQGTPADDVYCPPITVTEGGAAIQAYGGGRTGDATALRSQVSLGDVARECTGQPDGSTRVKIGVETRALLGAGGSAGRYNVPLRIVVKSGSAVFANRSRQMALAIPAGETQASVSVIEEDIVVPAASANDFEIEVGLGAQAAPRARRR